MTGRLVSENPPGLADPLAQFAEDLRQLRHRAGDISYRDLAKRAQMSPAALSQAASGRKLPTWNVTRAFVRGCDGDVQVWRERWVQVRRELNARQTDTTDGQAALSALSGKAADSTLNGRAPESENGRAPEVTLNGKVPASAPHHTTGSRRRSVPIRVTVLISVAATLLLTGFMINWLYGQGGADSTGPTASASPPVITTYIHGEYKGVAGLYATPWPPQAEINNPPYTVQSTGELNIVCQVSDGAVMKAKLVNASGVAREEVNDIWYRVLPSNYYIPAIYTTYPYGVEGILPPDAPFGTEIPQCAEVS